MISRTYHRALDFIAPLRFTANSERSSVEDGFRWLLRTLLIWGVLELAIGIPLFVERKLAAVAILATLIATYFACLFLLNHGRFHISRWIFISVTWLTTTIVYTYSGGAQGNARLLFLAAVVPTGWLLGRSSAFIVTALTMAYALVLAILEKNGIHSPRYFPLQNPLSTWFLLLWCVILAVAPLNQVMQSLQRVAARYRSLLNSVDGIVWEADAQTLEFTFVSPSILRILGYHPEDWVRGPGYWQDHIHPDDREMAMQHCREAVQTRECRDIKYRTIDAAGKTIWLHDLLTPLSETGRPLTLRGIMLDITPQAETDARLKASEADFRALVENAPCGICRAKPDIDHFIAVNPALVDMLGYHSADELLAASLANDIYATPQGRLRALESLVPNGVYEIEADWKRKDGTVIRIRAIGRRVLNPNGGAEHLESIIEEITERVVLEQRLRQAQKMEAIGHLAGGVAHDFNNLLGVILGNTELISSRLDQVNPLQRKLSTIHKAAANAASLTRQLLAFSRKQVMQPAVLDLNSVIRNMEALLRRLLTDCIELHISPSSVPALVTADQVQMEQVITNLASNARDAMPQGGKLMIMTSIVELDERRQQRAGGIPHVRLRMIDSGIGMDEATRSQIFEPFFTTKGLGRGTGLGLATVYGIVQQSGGSISVHSRPTLGTTFEIYLPLVRQSVAATEIGSLEEAQGDAETLLIVEDSEPLREISRQYLQNHGYHVLAAATGSDAMRESRDYPGEIALLISDVALPDETGRALTRRLRETRPGMSVLYVSVHAANVILEHGVLEPGASFLQKPYSCPALLMKIGEVLGPPKAVNLAQNDRKVQSG